MGGRLWSVVAWGLAMGAAGWARGEVVSFDFSGSGGALNSVTVAGSNPVYSATAVGKTYDSSLFSGVAVFTNPPTFASGTGVKIYQMDIGLGVDSDSVSTEVGTTNRRINSYSRFAEVLWVTIAPPSGYEITSATLINVENGEAGGLLDASGNELPFIASLDGLDLTFTPPLQANTFGVYESNRGTQPTAPGIKLSQFQITLSASAAPLPRAVWAGGALLVGVAVMKRRRGAVAG